MTRTLALDPDGNLSWCSVPEDQRGVAKGCPHLSHQKPGQSAAEFSIESNARSSTKEDIQAEIVKDYGLIEKVEKSIALNHEIEAYGAKSVEENLSPEELGALSREMYDWYDVKGQTPQDTVLYAISMIHDSARGRHRIKDPYLTEPGNIHNIGSSIQDIPKQLVSDLYFYSKFVEENSKDGVIVAPKNLKTAFAEYTNNSNKN